VDNVDNQQAAHAGLEDFNDVAGTVPAMENGVVAAAAAASSANAAAAAAAASTANAAAAAATAGLTNAAAAAPTASSGSAAAAAAITSPAKGDASGDWAAAGVSGCFPFLSCRKFNQGSKKGKASAMWAHAANFFTLRPTVAKAGAEGKAAHHSLSVEKEGSPKEHSSLKGLLGRKVAGTFRPKGQ
jgi:hypothetical protein